MTDAGLATVCGLAGLRWLSMAGSDGVRSPGFQGLCRLAALEFLCVQKCFRSVWQIQKEIPFDQFVSCTALCQWLSQRHRIEAWVRTLLLPESGS